MKNEPTCDTCTNSTEVEPNIHNDNHNHYCIKHGIYINGGDSCCWWIEEKSYEESNN